MTTKVDIKELLKAGAHFGHKTSHWNPRMQPYIHSKRGNIYIIDLVKTTEALEAALAFVHSLTSEGKKVLFVGTKRHIRAVVKQAAETAKMPYMTERWFGGTLTNFATVVGRVKHLRKLEDQLESGELKGVFNKREIGEVQAQVDKLNQTFSGLKEMESLPAALFVADVHSDEIAVREAKRLNIPVIGVADTNANPSDLDYVIPANDDALSAVKLITELVAAAAAEGAAKSKKAGKEEG